MSLLGANLEAFLAVVRRKTVLAAAADIGITQTGVTQRLRALERELDASLFIRSRRGMLLTSEGESLLRYCQAAKDLEFEALAKIKSPGRDAEVRLSVRGPTSLMRTRVIRACLPVMQKFPHLLMRFDISDRGSSAEALKTGEAQLAVLGVAEVSREMDSKTLKAEEYVAVASRKWKNRDFKDIVANERIIDFDDTDQATLNYLKKFKVQNLARAERHFVNNNESLLELIAGAFGYGVLTREFAQEFSKTADLVILNGDRAVENRVALAWYPRANPAAYFKALVDAIH